MSPHGIARSQNQSSSNSGKKCPLARPPTVQNFVAIRQEVSEISAIENLCSPKKWAKIHQNRLRPATLKSPPHHAKFHRDWWNHLGEKRYNFFTPFNILAPQRDTLIQRSPVCMVGYNNPPSCSYLQNFIPFRRLLSEISAAKLRRFCCWRDPTKTYSKRYVSVLHAATIST